MNPDLVTMPVRLWKKDHLALKKLSFLTGKHMSEIMRDIMHDYLETQKKLLTRSDIVIS
jgi:hypothetical protein